MAMTSSPVISRTVANGPAYQAAPECDCCGTKMTPIWFTDPEFIVDHGVMIPTGRTRRAVSHFECPLCCSKAAVDDSFDGPWHY